MKKRVLVIEDYEPFRKTLINLLEEEGYIATGAKDAHQAIEAAKEGAFELIVVDVRLPGGIDGIETITKIRQMLPELRSKVIVITGYVDSDAYDRAQKAGIVQFIYKPFKLREFLDLVNKVEGNDSVK